MIPRARVLASVERREYDRIPIKHLAVGEVDEMLLRHFGLKEHYDLLDTLGHDFREVGPRYCGPKMGDSVSEEGVISASVWGFAIRSQRPGAEYPLAEATAVSDLDRFSFPTPEWYDYSTMAEQCNQHSNYARILGYCEGDFINSISSLRSYELVLMDIATRDPAYLELVHRRFEFMYEHLRRGLEAAEGQIEFVHFGDDLGTQEGILMSPTTFRGIFGEPYREMMDLTHRHGARTMMHVCGSVVGMIPTLIDLGLDVLDVVQTNAVGMNLEALKRDFGRDLTFAGTMCVQRVIPFATPAEVRAEVEWRLELFSEGGLIIGPSHTLHVDSPLENVLEMYRAAGGLR